MAPKSLLHESQVAIFLSSMEKQHASMAIAGSKVLQCEFTGEERSTRVIAGSRTRAGAVAVFSGRQSSSPHAAPGATVTPPRTKVATKSNIGDQTNMPRIEVGMRGEFYFETKWYSVEIIESYSSYSSSTTTTSQSEQIEELFVVNYLNSRGRRGKDHTEDVSAEWLRGLVCFDPDKPNRSPSMKRSVSHATPRYYEGMLSECRTEQSGPDAEHVFAPYAPGYVTRVLSDEEVQFKFFDSNHGTKSANVTDLLFLSGPSIAGSAVTECEHADDQARTIGESRNDFHSEEDDTDMVSDDADTDAFLADMEIGATKLPAKRVAPKKSVGPSSPVDGTAESQMPKKKRARQDPDNIASIELDGNPICSICREDFSTDQSSFDDLRESKLPVSSMQCSHRVCCECLTRWQALEIAKYRVVKKDRPKPKWMACPECKRSTAFNAVDMKIDTLLCGCLNAISRQDAKIEKQEAEITRLNAEIESMKKASAGSRNEKIAVEI